MSDMSAEEKRRLALELFALETARLQNRSSVITSHTDATARRIEKKTAVLSSLSQNGITWNDLKTAYDEAFQRGHDAMLDFKLAYF